MTTLIVTFIVLAAIIVAAGVVLARCGDRIAELTGLGRSLVGMVLLAAGANDVGGTLINESISTSAGASYGQLVPPAELRRLIRDAGRVPAQRSTTYDVLRVYEVEDETADSPLDHVQDAEARFGSYRALASSGKFRFLHPTRVQGG